MNHLKKEYLKKAQENKPVLTEHILTPEVFSGAVGMGDELVLDLGNHYVGYLSFFLDYADRCFDSPVRLRFQFCEIKRELCDDFSSYKGTLSSTWLQECVEDIAVTGTYNLQRRFAARYIKITVIQSPTKIQFKQVIFKAVTSAGMDIIPKVSTGDDELDTIDTIAKNTLKNCMQYVFEDGPKRDRRLWSGDLRLEALTNYCVFNNTQLVRRCLYMFAASDRNTNGIITSHVFDTEKLCSGSWYLLDYALLYVGTVCDYYLYTNDVNVFNDLYPVIKEQMDAVDSFTDSNGILSIAKGCDAFIDWCKDLKKITSLHGVYLYVLSMLCDVLKTVRHKDYDVFASRLKNARSSAKAILYNEAEKNFSNKIDHYQKSVHSVVWMILGKVIDKADGNRLLREALHSKEYIQPFTPYMHHYVVEALFEVGTDEEAFNYIKKIWGGMAKLGTDTFFEVYVPEDPEFSPYGDRLINSMCHAWSCTPSYFIRKKLIQKECCGQ